MSGLNPLLFPIFTGAWERAQCKGSLDLVIHRRYKMFFSSQDEKKKDENLGSSPVYSKR